MSQDVQEPVRQAAVDRWQRSVDVVVVGFGMGGACAALGAAEAGARVLVLERASGGGGASALSEGQFYLGGGTDVQLGCGYTDDPESMYAFLRASTTASGERLRTYCDGSVEHAAWLEKMGVPFERRALTTKAVASHTGEGLLVTGNEYAHPYREVTRPAPRGHQTRASSDDHGGAVAMRALMAAVADASEIEVICDSRVVALIVDDDAVCGVKTRIGGEDVYVAATGGVVLATGSFNLNAEMTAQFLPDVHQHATPLGTSDNDGAGIRLGLSVGADTENIDGCLVTASIYPPEGLIRGIVINRDGRRFVPEDVYHGRLGHLIRQQPEQQAYLVVDEESFDYPSRGHKLLGVWDTVETVETELGLPAGSLAETIAEYNRGAGGSGHDEQFHKSDKYVKVISGPLAVFDISLGNRAYSFIGLGGLRANRDGQAISRTGVPVPGLYAVGACAAHLSANGAEYASGLSLGPASLFGRRAGRHAAGQARG